MDLVPKSNNNEVRFGAIDVETMATALVQRYEGRDNEDLHRDVATMRKVLQSALEKKPLVKTLKVSWHDGGSNPIRLIFDNDPSIPTDHEHFVTAQNILITDTYESTYVCTSN